MSPPDRMRLRGLRVRLSDRAFGPIADMLCGARSIERGARWMVLEEDGAELVLVLPTLDRLHPTVITIVRREVEIDESDPDTRDRLHRRLQEQLKEERTVEVERAIHAELRRRSGL